MKTIRPLVITALKKRVRKGEARKRKMTRHRVEKTRRSSLLRKNHKISPINYSTITIKTSAKCLYSKKFQRKCKKKGNSFNRLNKTKKGEKRKRCEEMLECGEREGKSQLQLGTYDYGCCLLGTRLSRPGTYYLTQERTSIW